MRKLLVLGIAVLCAAPVAASTGTHCDSTPFTLGKPAAATPKEEVTQPKSKPPTVAEAKKPQPKREAKQGLLASCKGGKAKKSG